MTYLGSYNMIMNYNIQNIALHNDDQLRVNLYCINYRNNY